MNNPDNDQGLHLINIESLRQQINNVFIGQQDVVENILVALLSAGHVLIEGVPGLGKTLLVRALAKTFTGDYSRVQFTPDLMPSDITGHVMFDAENSKFKIRKGPVFTNLLLADEINRAPAKSQAALLEVMQEQQVTLEGKPLAVPQPFMVFATQNPIEQEGTYPLPEAQLDRFIMKIKIDYPEHDHEVDIVRQVTQNNTGESFNLSDVKAVADPESILNLQHYTSNIQVDDAINQYAVEIVRQTRNWPGISIGSGPRGAIALARCARAYSVLRGREYVIPDDIKAIAVPVLRHRIRLSPEYELEGMDEDQVITSLLTKVDAPRQ